MNGNQTRYAVLCEIKIFQEYHLMYTRVSSLVSLVCHAAPGSLMVANDY